MTKEQKDVIEEIIESIMSHPCDRGLDQWHVDILRDMLDPSRPVWEITEERKETLRDVTNLLGWAIDKATNDEKGKARYARAMIRAMLEETELKGAEPKCAECTWYDDGKEHRKQYFHSTCNTDAMCATPVDGKRAACHLFSPRTKEVLK